MPRCSECDKWGIFLTLENGLCRDCIEKVRAQNAARRLEQTRKAEEAKRRQEAETRRREIESDPSYLLEKVRRSTIPRPPMLQGVPMVYSYVLKASEVDRAALYKMTQEERFDLTMTIADSGAVLLSDGEAPVAKLAQKTEIAADWINKKLPYICQFSRFERHNEVVVLHLYRDDEARLKNCTATVAKLTACVSGENQENIFMLEKGQKLFVEEDDDGKLYVRDINCHEIGKLPAKFQRMYGDGLLRGMFFAYTETIEDANGDAKEIPYVKFYHD